MWIFALREVREPLWARSITWERPASIFTAHAGRHGKRKALVPSCVLLPGAPSGYELCVGYTDGRKHKIFHKKAFLFKEMTFPAYYKKQLYKDLVLGPVIKLIFCKKKKSKRFLFSDIDFAFVLRHKKHVQKDNICCVLMLCQIKNKKLFFLCCYEHSLGRWFTNLLKSPIMPPCFRFYGMVL